MAAVYPVHTTPAKGDVSGHHFQCLSLRILIDTATAFITPSPPLSDAQSSSQRGPSPSQDSFPPMIQDRMPDTDPSPASSVQNLLIQHMQVEQAKQTQKSKTARNSTSASLSNSTDSLVTSSSFLEDDGIASPAFKQIGARLGVAASARPPAVYSSSRFQAASTVPQSIPLHRKRDSNTSLAELDRDSPFSEQSGETRTPTGRTPQKAGLRQRTRSMQRAWSAYPFKEASANPDDVDLNEYQSRRASMPAAITPYSSAEPSDPWYMTGLVQSLPSSTETFAPAVGMPAKPSVPSSPGEKGLRRLKSTPVGESMILESFHDNSSF